MRLRSRAFRVAVSGLLGLAAATGAARAQAEPPPTSPTAPTATGPLPPPPRPLAPPAAAPGAAGAPSGSLPTTAPAAGPAMFAPPPPTPFAPPPGVEVHVTADDARAGVWQVDPQRRVMFREEPALVYSFVCAAPCDARLDPAGRYRVMGDGLVPSHPFRLPSGARSAAIAASTGSSGVRSAAFVAGGLGLAAALFSGVMFVAEGTERDTARGFGDDFPVERDRMNGHANVYRNVGVVGLVVTGVAVLTSIALLAASRTSVAVQAR